MSYRKREIAHWNQGKGCKGIRKAKERTFVEREIEEQIAQQDPNFRYRHKTRHPNKEAQIQHWIDWYEQRIAAYEREPQGHWSCSWASYARDGLRKARKQLKELQEKKDVRVRS